MYLISTIEWLSRFILLLLLTLSIWSIAIIIERRRYFLQFFKNSKLLELKNILKNNDIKIVNEKDLPTNCFYSNLLREMISMKSKEKIEYAYAYFLQEKRIELEMGLAVLGTLGPTSPFIGLLGTIMGIIVSFGKLSQGEGSSNAVMFALAEALILTAVGLLVAIPAVIAFNYFSKKIKTIMSESQGLKDLYLAKKVD